MYVLVEMLQCLLNDKDDNNDDNGIYWLNTCPKYKYFIVYPIYDFIQW